MLFKHGVLEWLVDWVAMITGDEDELSEVNEIDA